MTEYIDLDTPLEVYVEHGVFCKKQISTLRDLLNTNKIPYTVADVRPVVYCKDCMHSVQGKKSLECEKHRYVWNNLNRWVNDDDFCSWGIKREES